MTRYLVCRTCGTFVSAREAVERAYCSDGCTVRYGTCVTCGRFFRTGEGFDADHCTQACTVRYQIMRRYGPEPVTMVTEE